MSRKHNNRFFDHDDRGSGSNHNIRKVTFRNNYGRIHKAKKEDKGRERFFARLKGDEDDAVMGGCDIQRLRINERGNFKNRSKSPTTRQNALKPADWYRVKVIYGAKIEKNSLIRALLKHLSPFVFIPVGYSVVGNHACFYVDNIEAAKMIQSANRKIKLYGGRNLVLLVHESYLPGITMDYELEEKIKQVMAKRYIAENKALDLSNFSSMPEFQPGVFYSLSRRPMLRAVLRIINENIPDIYALDLTGNKIEVIDKVSAMEFQKMKNLRILHLANNSIRDFGALYSMMGMEITELVLKDNPISETISDASHFVSEIRKRFPKLVKLDNAELPPVVSFDFGEESKLPTAQASFMCNPEGRGIVREFLSQYFALFDSDNRADLVQAYHNDAHFSQCTYQSLNQHYSADRLNAYKVESRNLFKIVDSHRRKTRLRMGKENIVKYLRELPKTQHDLSSFVVDLTLFTPALMNLSVCGVFREPNSSPESSWLVRHFSRVFLIVPVGQGFCIVNDSLFITSATDEEKAASFKVETQNSAILQSPTSQPSLPQGAPADASVRLQMVQTLATQSGMNLEWSEKCLTETQWNFDRALWTFMELQKQGTIPSEAFVK